MAPNGTGRKAPTPAPATNGKSKKLNFVKKSLIDGAFTFDEAKRAVKLKEDVTKRLPKPSKPGNWDSDVVGCADTAPAPNITPIPAELAKSFTTGRPMTDPPDLLRCNHCRRPVLRHTAKAHIEDCLAKKQEKQRKKKEAKDARDAAARKEARGESTTPEAEDTLEGKTAGKTQGGKKRKAEDEGGKATKKKKKDEIKIKAPRPKAPVDVERQCGVELPNGGQCARSLTCKSHSMGAKRAVPGRSAPYDKLLADYQRKNQAKLQKQAMESQPQLADDDYAQNGPIDSDEEKDLVLAAIARSRPQPLWQSQRLPLKQKYQMVRMKEMLSGALSGRNGAGLFRTTPKDETNGVGLGLGMTNGVGGATMSDSPEQQQQQQQQQLLQQQQQQRRMSAMQQQHGKHPTPGVMPSRKVSAA